MTLEFQEALDLVVSRTGHEGFRLSLDACDDDHQRANFRAWVLATAAGYQTGEPVVYSEARRPRPGPGPGPEPVLPSFGRQVANFAAALVSHIAAGMPRADEATIASRLAICETCPQLIRPEYRCGSLPDGAGCGCHVRRKAEWLDMHCPADPPKW